MGGYNAGLPGMETGEEGKQDWSEGIQFYRKKISSGQSY